MATHIGLELPLPFDELIKYIEAAKDYAFMNGIVIKKQVKNKKTDVSGDVIGHLPVTLLPSIVSASIFEDLKQIQCSYLEMYHSIAHDFEFLELCLKPLAQVDNFIGNLWKIHEAVKTKPKSEHRCLMLVRNDFMIDESTSTPVAKQIEINTMAAGMGGYGSKMKKYHEYTLRKMHVNYQSENLVESRHNEEFAKAMLEAWTLYGNKQSAILFVVLEVNRMIHDHRCLEHAIGRQNPNVEVIFTVLPELFENGSVKNDGALYFVDREIGLVYFRTAIQESEMKTDESCKVRLMIESSKAILCPCIHGQLAGSKRVQQVLSNVGMVEKYVKYRKVSEKIRATFVNQYPTDHSPLARKGIQLALKNPDNFVLKSPSDGGGHNFYGDDIVNILNNLDYNHTRGKYVLMERVRPKSYPNYLIVDSKPVSFCETVTELGLFTSGLCSGGEVTTRYCGQMCKTKPADSNDGGLLLGISCVDSILLV